MVTGEPVLAEQDLNTFDWRMLTTMTNTSIEKQFQKQSSSSSPFLCPGNLTAHLGVNVNVNTLTATSPADITPTLSVPGGRVQCPICFRLSSTKDFGRCLGVPTADYPLKSSTNYQCHGVSTGIGFGIGGGGVAAPGLTNTNPRKRKRTELRSAHEVQFAPCHECLDTIGEEDGRVWGRCDNPKCWSRRGETTSNSSSSANSGSGYGSGVDGLPGALGVVDQSDDDLATTTTTMTSSHVACIGLVCPKCSPEGGLGCEHKWICDMCAFWGKFPLVWECPGCHNDFCDKCPEMQDRCVECGCSDLCRDCKKDPGVIQELQFQMAMRGEAELASSPLFAWRCRLCSIPVCKSCLVTARWGGRVDDCANCEAQLCAGCRSVMECTGCGEEMCQLCPMESLALHCKRCARTKDPFRI
ncbi:hypothetical protein K435DRAFT_371593 [Dendrothele bispora CBS 962.96]|uniref:Uncharacterized protein n=1 Tax=Dendrothele bispora (strain CBS 962.96) TaxID=1314807 RepID=A0A4S8LBV9_DENBC|nr:hypothetical protein K435DRAFT_371593 [Dendrothele bispora CBS 962.96]